jgi:hypothetical protein
MNAKEKAERLIADHETFIESNCNQSSRAAHYNAACNSAIITANNVIELAIWADDAVHDYWKEVKNYIEAIQKGDDFYLKMENGKS